MRGNADKRNAQRREKYKNDPKTRKGNIERSKKTAEKYKGKLNKPYNERTYQKIYTAVKHRCQHPSRGKGWLFDISLEYALETAKKQGDKCTLTGIPFTFTRTGDRYHDALLPSIDRINSDLGYIPGNIQWVNQWANFAKRHYTTKFFQEMCVHTVQNINKLPKRLKYPIPQVYIETHLEPLKPIELNPKVKHLKNLYTPLRKCTHCGREAWTFKDLEKFKKNKRLPWRHENTCKECTNKIIRQKTALRRQQNQPAWLRKCKYCGLEAHTEKDLKPFAKSKRSLYGHMNLCKKCKNKKDKERRHRKPKH